MSLNLRTFDIHMASLIPSLFRFDDRGAYPSSRFIWLQTFGRDLLSSFFNSFGYCFNSSRSNFRDYERIRCIMK